MGERLGLERVTVSNLLPVCLAVALMLTSVGRGVAAPAVKPLPPITQRNAMMEPVVPPPIVLESLELNESEAGVEVDLAASGALVWTSYRNGDGDLVVELPNSTPSADLAELTPSSGLVSRVQVEARQDGSRPLTRITFTTRREVEHSLAADGDALRLSLVPMGGAPLPELAYEPVPEPTAVAEAPAPEPASLRPNVEPEEPAAATPLATFSRDWGTAENPRRSTPPRGVAASRLSRIEVLNDGAVKIQGDGEFLYSTFRLSEPERFVIDLSGVVNTSNGGVKTVGGDVSRVRVAQFKPFPEPVSRVVFDLSNRAEPTIERSSEGLLVSFGASAPRVADLPEPTPQPVPAPAPEPREAPAEVAAADVTEPADDPMRSIVPARADAPPHSSTFPNEGWGRDPVARREDLAGRAFFLTPAAPRVHFQTERRSP